jgi:tetratricopeptide (TPR) repeat protein
MDPRRRLPVLAIASLVLTGIGIADVVVAERSAALEAPDDPVVAAEVQRLGGVADRAFAAGNHADAEVALRQLLVICQAENGPADPCVASLRGQIATVLYMQGRYADARQQFESALELARTAHGQDSIEVADLCHGLGRSMFQQRRAEEAEAPLRCAVDVSARVRGKEDPQTLLAMNDLAGDLVWQGRNADAEPIFAAVLAARQGTLGEVHAETAASHFHLATSIAAQGRYDQAQGHYLQALEASRRVNGEEHPDTATYYDALAGVLDELGRPAEATPLHSRALEIRRRVLGEEHVETATGYANLAYNLGELGRHAEAQPLYERALAIELRELGADHPSVATTYNNLASCVAAQGRYAEAEPLFRRALALRIAALGDDHPDTASSYGNLAWNLDQQGRYPEALPLHERALAIRRQALGEFHPDTASSHAAVGSNLQARGRVEEAQPHLERSLEIRRRVYGDEHRETANACENLSANLQVQGRAAEAEPLAREALAIQVRALGERHPDTASAYANLGLVLQSLGRYYEAAPLFSRALEILIDAHGEQHPWTATAYLTVGYNLFLQERHAEADRMYGRCLAIRRQVLGEDHPDTAVAYNNIAVNLSDQGRYAEALPVHRKVLEIRRRVLGEEHPQTATALDNLARNLLALDEIEEAESLSRQALEVSRRVLGESHPDTATRYLGLAKILYRTGRDAEAARYGEQALAIRRESLGATHPDTELSLIDVASMQLRVPGGTGAALDHARDATRILRTRRGRTGADRLDEAQGLREARAVSFHYLLLADIDWQRASESPGDSSELQEESFAALQDATASSAGAALAQMGARFGAGDQELAQRVRQRQDLASRAAAIDAAILQALGDGQANSRARTQQLRADAAATQVELNQVDNLLRERFPEYFALVSPDALGTSELQPLLRDNEALVLLVAGLRGTHVHAVTPRGTKWVRSAWDYRQVEAAVERLRCDLDPGRCRASAGVAGDAASRGARRTDAPERAQPRLGPSYDLETAYELYAQLFEPIRDVLAGISNLYVVTTGPLSSLPLAVLVTRPPPAGANLSDPDVLRQAPWLLRDFAITTLPSVSSLKSLRRYAGGSNAPTDAKSLEFLGFGDPVFAGDAAAGRGSTRALDLFGGTAAGGSGLADPEMLRRSFQPLPGTRVELEAMRAAFAPGAEVRLGTQATEGAVKRSPLAQARVLAFATHGLVAGEIDGIAEPGLLFTPPQVATEDDDGLLTASEVAQLRLGADWVLLSACNTAAPDGTPGADALSGLARAFFYAGARSLLVSHWPVRDDVASRLTVDAIRRQQADATGGRGEAVRQAQLAVLQSPATPAFAHPSAWAPFSLVGEGI